MDKKEAEASPNHHESVGDRIQHRCSTSHQSPSHVEGATVPTDASSSNPASSPPPPVPPRHRYGTFHGRERGGRSDGLSRWVPLPGSKGFWDEDDDDYPGI